MDLPVLLLHKYPEYKMQCCELINDEWKRSVTARMRGLDCSCDTLPTNLILLKDNKVIGHCKLSRIPNLKGACFIESVVIDRHLRGKGFGKYLMQKAEEYCIRHLNLKALYLSTKGQEMFYNKLGYNKCPPISIYGSTIINLPKYFSNCAITNNLKQNNTDSISPTPPPMPMTINNHTEDSKVYMHKSL